MRYWRKVTSASSEDFRTDDGEQSTTSTDSENIEFTKTKGFKNKTIRAWRKSKSPKYALYAALVAIRHNLKMSDFYLCLVNNGKPKKLALIAVARKLLVIACSILNSNQKYDERYVSVLKFSNNLVKITA